MNCEDVLPTQHEELTVLLQTLHRYYGEYNALESYVNLLEERIRQEDNDPLVKRLLEERDDLDKRIYDIFFEIKRVASQVVALSSECLNAMKL